MTMRNFVARSERQAVKNGSRTPRKIFDWKSSATMSESAFLWVQTINSQPKISECRWDGLRREVHSSWEPGRRVEITLCRIFYRDGAGLGKIEIEASRYFKLAVDRAIQMQKLNMKWF
jgi:hypothetical protein